MTHQPIFIQNIAARFLEKVCFKDFFAAIYPGRRIAITGSNGQGKSLLLKIIQGLFEPTSGAVCIPKALTFAYVPQNEARDMRKHELRRERIQAHLSLMREQTRAKKRKAYGEKKYDGDKLALRSAQGRGQLSVNNNRKRLAARTRTINDELSSLRLPEIIRPNFAIDASLGRSTKPVLFIKDGVCSYDEAVVSIVNLQICAGQTLAIVGPNGSGKTTLAKTIMGHKKVSRQGIWLMPNQNQIGYLDQHYGNLDLNLSPWEVIISEAPSWTREQAREHLNSFLFRKNEEVNNKIVHLSGGEKARLSLAIIAAKNPALLIIDEITNNLDMRTREHVIEIMNAYPGALLAISHDEEFLRAINATIYNLPAREHIDSC